MKQLLVLLLFVCASVLSSADTLYVASIAEAGGNGQSWNAAFRTINYAFAEWQAGDEIWVARGTYMMPDSGYNVKNGMHIYGGFLGTETAREQRDWYRQRSIMKNGAPSTVAFVINECDSSTRIDGLVIESGGINVRGGAPRIFNCHFRLCNGGALNGAALRVQQSSRIRIEYCVFENNTTDGDGGAVSITGGTGDVKGFGAFLGQCFFVNNQATEAGGLFISNCAGVTQLASCVFAKNVARAFSGAIESEASYLYITNTTFYKNSVVPVQDSAPLTITLSGGYIQNSIIWNADDVTAPHLTVIKTIEDTTTFTSTANLIERDFVNGFWQNDPSFENMDDLDGADNFFGTDDDGLALSSFSSARDGGVIDRFVNHRQNDVIGNPRLVGRKNDLGAYESQRSGRVGYREVMAEMRTGKLVFMFRHGKTDWDQKDPGPSAECFPGRNLIAEGREQSTGIGAQQRMLGVIQGDAFTSTACRCWETLQKMIGRYEKKGYWASGGSSTTMDQRWNDLSSIPTNGNRIISTHDAVANLLFNADGGGEIMTTAELMEGDAMIVRPLGDTAEVLAQWCSDTWERYHVRFPEGVTDVAENNNTSVVHTISVAPVPSNESVTITTTTPSRLVIVNIIGEVVASFDVVQSITLNTSSWPVGFYAIGSNNETGRLVITR